MDSTNIIQLITSLSLLLLSVGTVNSQAAVSLTVSPNSKIRPGDSVSYQCTVDTTQISLQSNSIEWKRQTGSVIYKIGVDNFIVGDESFSSRGRYSIERTSSADGKTVAFTLKISSAKLEDSGTIICGIHLRESTLPLAVCDDTSSYSCECIINNYGWASPECFEEPPDWRNDRAGHNRTIIGLGVCLAIAVIFGIVMAIMVGRDCMQKMYEKELKRQERQKKLRQNGVSVRRSAYTDSEVLQLDPNDTSSTTGLKEQEANQYEDVTDSGRASTSGSSPVPEDKQGYPAYPGYSTQRATHAAETHTNKAYQHEDDGYSSVSGENGGARPKTGNNYSYPAAPPRKSKLADESNSYPSSQDKGIPPPRYTEDYPSSNANPYQGSAARQYPPESPRTLGDQYAPQQQYSSPGAISSISYNDRPSYPQAEVPARGAYTDRPKEKRGGQYPDSRAGHTDPRRLDFHDGQSNPYHIEGRPQIDSGSTMI